MEITIKKYTQDNEEAFRDLMDVTNEEEDLGLIVKSPDLESAYTAFHDHTLVGVLIAWTNSYHNACIYFRIIVHPSYQDLSVKEKLLAKLESLESPLPMQTSFWETTTDIKIFLEQMGFCLLRKTYMPVLSVREFSGLMVPTIENGKLKTLSEIISNDMLLEKIIQLAKLNYEVTHRDNPIAEMTLAKWEQLILADDCDLQGSYILVDSSGAEVLAYSFLHESVDDDTLELGWCGSIDAETMSTIPKLISHQIQYAAEHGCTYLQGEFDTTSQYAMEVFQAIPFPPCAAWVTYQKIQQNGE